MLKGCDILDEASNIYKNINKDAKGLINLMEVESLMSTFELCAKTCAGDYYVAVSFSN